MKYLKRSNFKDWYTLDYQSDNVLELVLKGEKEKSKANFTHYSISFYGSYYMLVCFYTKKGEN